MEYYSPSLILTSTQISMNGAGGAVVVPTVVEYAHSWPLESSGDDEEDKDLPFHVLSADAGSSGDSEEGGFVSLCAKLRELEETRKTLRSISTKIQIRLLPLTQRLPSTQRLSLIGERPSQRTGRFESLRPPTQLMVHPSMRWDGGAPLGRPERDRNDEDGIPLMTKFASLVAREQRENGIAWIQ